MKLESIEKKENLFELKLKISDNQYTIILLTEEELTKWYLLIEQSLRRG